MTAPRHLERAFSIKEDQAMTQDKRGNGALIRARRQDWLDRIMASAEALHRIQFDAPWRRQRDGCRG